MKYKVEWKRKAFKQLAKVQRQQQSKIQDAVTKLENSETWGDYRVLFNATNDETIEINDVSIEEVKKRDDRTY